MSEEDKKYEAPVLANVRLEACRMAKHGLPMRLLRNNRGLFKTLDGKRTVSAGLEADGSSDLLGITTLVITPQMVGMSLGVATVAEVKRPGWTKPTNEHERTQENFINQVNKRGGIGFFIDDHETLGDKVKEIIKKRVDGNQKTV